MKVLFWNVQRLGRGTPVLRRETREDLVENFLLDSDFADVTYVLFAEVTSGVLTIHPVEKQLTGKGRSPRPSHQLGYAGFAPGAPTRSHAGAPFPDRATIDLVPEEIPPFSEVWGQSPRGSGSDVFGDRARRYVARVGRAAGANLYMFHANASEQAPLLVAWAAKHLHDKHDGDFVLFGDMNCTPQALASRLSLLERQMQGGRTGRGTTARNRPLALLEKSGGADELFQQPHTRTLLASSFRLSDGGPTYNARGALTKTLDWAIAGSRSHVHVRVVHREYARIIASGAIDAHRGAGAAADASAGSLISDHLPIIVEMV